ncbi:hypothetical protein OG301_39245 (plasmid) [Streptomyces platensis]|uniref:hypothetical protein n=1 Tax=Streptomyces platensis TaxID=58346 RepID=UPI002ED48747|nr:hypothetical protein OG301_39245 [Streptomyces platensis]
MRRPALHHPHPATGWTHPYPTGLFSAVFYNDGAEHDGTESAAPSPAQLAARAEAQAPNHNASPVDPDLDDDKVTLTQRRLNIIMKDTKEAARRSTVRALAEATGLDPDQVDLDQIGRLVKDAQETREAALTEEQRRMEALEKREKALEAREVETVRRARETSIQAALVRLGAADDDLLDAYDILERRVPQDADADAIATAAKTLKDSRPYFFGGTAPTPEPTALPPAPGGSPAGGPGPRPAISSKDAIKDEAKALAISMGLRKRDDAA